MANLYPIDNERGMTLEERGEYYRTRKKYPIGIQTFEEVRNLRRVYVDKTGYVYKMAQSDMKYVFLSRPRRFGKSLLTTTLKSYFEGRRDLFEGLAIEKLEKEWKEYPVIHLDMSRGKGKDEEGLRKFIVGRLKRQEKIHGIPDYDETEPGERFANLIETLHDRRDSNVVVLIDEYDAPMLDAVHDEERLAKVRDVMRYFYETLKECENYIRFAFMTGIAKFSQLSIFSALNNISDITLDPEYDAVCGITEQELRTQLTDGVDKLAAIENITREEVFRDLKLMYDGYHFTRTETEIYNPYSLLRALSTSCLDSYWFGTGTPTYLVNTLKKFEVLPADIGNVQAVAEDFDTPTEQIENHVPLFYQSGYLTITGYDKASGLYTLDVPNREVRRGLYGSLLPNYIDRPRIETNVITTSVYTALKDDRIEDALLWTQKYFSSLPHSTDPHLNSEAYYQQMLVGFMQACGIYARIEERSARGRIDMVFETRKKIYIFELKLDGSAETALQQINEKDYAGRYALGKLEVVKVGVNFSSKTRTLTDWEIA